MSPLETLERDPLVQEALQRFMGKFIHDRPHSLLNMAPVVSLLDQCPVSSGSTTQAQVVEPGHLATDDDLDAILPSK